MASSAWCRRLVEGPFVAVAGANGGRDRVASSKADHRATGVIESELYGARSSDWLTVTVGWPGGGGSNTTE